MRKLKWHEQKLLKKVDLLAWKSENGRREIEVMRRYHVQDRDDYKKYNKLAGMVSKLCGALRALPGSDAERIEMTRLLSARLYAMGLVNTNSAGIRCVKHCVTSHDSHSYTSFRRRMCRAIESKIEN